MANKPIMSATGTGMQPYMTLLGEKNHALLSGKHPRPQQVGPVTSAMPSSPRPQATGTATGGFGYQTGFNADRQALNTGHATGRLQKESQFTPQFGSATGKQGAADLVKSQQMNDQAQLRRGMETANAQMGLENQVNRAELMQAGLSNQAKIYADMTQRATDQISLAAQLQQAMIRNRAALTQALMGDA